MSLCDRRCVVFPDVLKMSRKRFKWHQRFSITRAGGRVRACLQQVRSIMYIILRCHDKVS